MSRLMRQRLGRIAFAQQTPRYEGELPILATITVGDDLVPLRRPQFRFDGNKASFLISQRTYATFDPAETALWTEIDGRRTVGELNACFPGARERLKSFWSRDLIELAEAEFASDRRPVLIVEPHMDDAVLSIGGLMWARRHEAEMTVLSVVSKSNYSSYHKIDRDFFDVEAVSALRSAETELVMRVLGGHFDSLNQFDAPLRFQPGDWALDWYVANRRAVSAYVNHSSSPDAIQPLADMLGAKFATSNARELWIPMGVGRSADHELTRNACIHALQQAPGLFEKFNVHFYQEVPYLAEFPDHAQRILREIQDAGGALTPECFDAGDVIAQKLRLVSIFGSQFKASHMSTKVAAAAHASGAGTGLEFAEVSFHMTALPRSPMADALYSGRVQIDATVRRLKRWYPRSCKATRVRIACPTGVGCWRDDMQQLLRAFPAAKFEVHLPADGMAETRAFQSDRITVHPVAGGRSGWLTCIAALLRSPHLPLVVVTGFRFAKLAPLVKAMLFPARPLPVSSIDNLVNALREVRS